MKINVKALLLWGIIFPFIISTIPMRNSSRNNHTELQLTNSFLDANALKQILDILEVSINGTYGEVIHNNVDNSLTTIDRELNNNQFGIVYYSSEFVDKERLITTILDDEKQNQLKLHEKIYDILTEYIEGEQLPDNFKIKTRVIIPNKGTFSDSIKAYALELVTQATLIDSLNNRDWSDNPEENMKLHLEQLENRGSLKLTILPNEL